jgi:hypothetical protein
VVESSALLKRRTSKGYRGFESLPHRQLQQHRSCNVPHRRRRQRVNPPRVCSLVRVAASDSQSFNRRPDPLLANNGCRNVDVTSLAWGCSRRRWRAARGSSGYGHRYYELSDKFVLPLVVKPKFVRPGPDKGSLFRASGAAREKRLLCAVNVVNVSRGFTARLPSDGRLARLGPTGDRVGIRPKNDSDNVIRGRRRSRRIRRRTSATDDKKTCKHKTKRSHA